MLLFRCKIDWKKFEDILICDYIVYVFFLFSLPDKIQFKILLEDPIELKFERNSIRLILAELFRRKRAVSLVIIQDRNNLIWLAATLTYDWWLQDKQKDLGASRKWFFSQVIRHNIWVLVSKKALKVIFAKIMLVVYRGALKWIFPIKRHFTTFKFNKKYFTQIKFSGH